MIRHSSLTRRAFLAGAGAVLAATALPSLAVARATAIRIGYQKAASTLVLLKAHGTLEKRFAPLGISSSTYRRIYETFLFDSQQDSTHRYTATNIVAMPDTDPSFSTFYQATRLGMAKAAIAQVVGEVDTAIRQAVENRLIGAFSGVAEDIRRVSQLLAEVSAATTQGAHGIEQLNGAARR